MDLRAQITATLLANVVPSEPGILDNYRVGASAQTLKLPGNLDQITVQKYDLAPSDSLTLDLFDLAQDSGEGELTPEDTPLAIARLYGLLVSIEDSGDEGSPGLEAIVTGAKHTGHDQDSPDPAPVTSPLTNYLYGDSSFILLTWADGILVGDAQLHVREMLGVAALTIKVVAIGSTDDGLPASS